MAGPSVVAAADNHQGIAPKPVQEILLNGGHHIPERYLNSNKDGLSEDINGGSIPLMDVPFIDMGLLSPTTSSTTKAQELAKLRQVLSSWGCFQLVNHGMTSSFLDQVRRVTKQFFALPHDEKQRYSRKSDGIEGYGTDNVYGQHTINWNDRLHLKVHPESQRELEFWPKNPKAFREVIEEFTAKCQLIVESLLKAMAISLNLEEKCFLDQYGEKGLMFARFNYYPPCPRPDLVLGIKPHTDGTAITILLQDSEVEALQVQKDDQWFRAPTIPHALFINVGDQMEIMSNGILKSAFHRVMTNAEKERISLAMLCSPELEREIGPADELINENQPKLFNNVKNYGQIYFQIDPTDEKRPIDLLRID